MLWVSYMRRVLQCSPYGGGCFVPFGFFQVGFFLTKSTMSASVILLLSLPYTPRFSHLPPTREAGWEHGKFSQLEISQREDLGKEGKMWRDFKQITA